MAWVIVTFSDKTVSCVPPKWLVKVGKVWKCYFPKSGAAAKIKALVEVDSNSKEWSLYSYRLLMDGETFLTYALARKAEKIAQDYSIMKSFEESYAAKQKSRKKPVVHFDSSHTSHTSHTSGSESESQDFKNIDKLAKVDAGLTLDIEKEYNYKNFTCKNENIGPLSADESSDSESSDTDDGCSLASGKDVENSESSDTDDGCSLASGEKIENKEAIHSTYFLLKRADTVYSLRLIYRLKSIA